MNTFSLGIAACKAATRRPEQRSFDFAAQGRHVKTFAADGDFRQRRRFQTATIRRRSHRSGDFRQPQFAADRTGVRGRPSACSDWPTRVWIALSIQACMRGVSSDIWLSVIGPWSRPILGSHPLDSTRSLSLLACLGLSLTPLSPQPSAKRADILHFDSREGWTGTEVLTPRPALVSLRGLLEETFR